MANNTTLKAGNWYRFIDTFGDGCQHIGQYMGRTQEFSCCICGKGCKAYEFNIHYAPTDGAYETWGYGPKHRPEFIEDLGASDEIIVDD